MKKRKISLSLLLIMLFNLVVPIYVDMAPVEAASNTEDKEYGERLDYLLQNKTDKRVTPVSYSGEWGAVPKHEPRKEGYRSKIRVKISGEEEFEDFSVSVDIKGKGRNHLIDNPEYDRHKTKNDEDSKTYLPSNIFQYYGIADKETFYTKVGPETLKSKDKFYLVIGESEITTNSDDYYKRELDYKKDKKEDKEDVGKEYYQKKDYRDGYKLEIPIKDEVTLSNLNDKEMEIHLPRMVQFDPLLRIVDHFKVDVNYRIKKADGSTETNTVPLIYYVDNKTEVNIYSHLMRGDYQERLDQDMLYKPGIDLYEDKENLIESKYNIYRKEAYDKGDKTNPLNGDTPIETDNKGMAKYLLDYKMDFELRSSDGEYKLAYGLDVNGNPQKENTIENNSEFYYVEDGNYIVRGNYDEKLEPHKFPKELDTDENIKRIPLYWESGKETIYTLRVNDKYIPTLQSGTTQGGITDNKERKVEKIENSHVYINFDDKKEKERIDLKPFDMKLSKDSKSETDIDIFSGNEKEIADLKSFPKIENNLTLYRNNKIYNIKEEEKNQFYVVDNKQLYKVKRVDNDDVKNNIKEGQWIFFKSGNWTTPIRINEGKDDINKDTVVMKKDIKWSKEKQKFYFTEGKEYYIDKENGKLESGGKLYLYEKELVHPYILKFKGENYYCKDKTEQINIGLGYPEYDIRNKEKGSLFSNSGVKFIENMIVREIYDDKSYIDIRYTIPRSSSKITREYYLSTHNRKIGIDELQDCIYQVGSDAKEYVIEETSVAKDKFNKKTTEGYNFKLPMYADQDGVKMESIKVSEMKELVKSILGDNKYNALLGEKEPYYYDKLPQYYLRYIDTNKYMDYHIYFLNYMPKIKMNGNNKAYEFKEDFDLEMDILNKNFDALAYWEMDIVRPDQIKIDRIEGINSVQEDLFSEKPSFIGDVETMDKIDYYLYLIDLYKEKGITIDSKEKDTVENLLNEKIALISKEEATKIKATKIKLDLTNEFDKKLLRGIALNKVLEEGYKIDSSHDLVRLCNFRYKISELKKKLEDIESVKTEDYKDEEIVDDINSFNEDIDKIKTLTEALNEKEIKSYDDFYKALEDFAKLEIALRELELKKEKINLAIDKYNSDSIKIDKIGKILDGLYLLEDKEGKEPISKEDIEVLVADLEKKFDIGTWENSEAKKKLDDANPLGLKSPKESFKTKEDLEAYMVAVSRNYDLEENKEQIASYLDIQKGIFDIEKIITSKDDPMEKLNTKIEIPEELVFKDVEDIINKIGKAEGLPNLSSDSEELKGYKKMLVNNDSFLKDTITWKYREVENFEDLQKDRDKRLKLKLKAHLDDKSESLDLDEDGYISCFMFRYGNRDDEKNKDSLLKETFDKKIFTGAIKVTKKDESNNPLPGAKFYLRNEEDQYYTNIEEKSIWIKESKDAKEFISMEDGSFLVRGLGNEEDKKVINQEEVEVKFKGKGAILYSGKQEREKIENLTSAYFYKDGKKQAIDLEKATEPFSMENNSRLYLNHTNKSGEKLKLIWTRRENKVEEESYKFLVKKTIENFDEPNVDKNDMKPTVMNDGLGIKYDNKGKVSIYDSNDIFTKEGKKLPKEVTGFNKIEMKKEGKVYVRIERKNDKLTITYPNSLENNIKEFFNEDKMAFRKNIDMSEVNRPGYEDPGLTGDDKINFYKDLQETLLDNLIELIPEDEKEIKEKEDIESIIDLIDTKVSGLDSKDNLIIKLEEIKKELVISDLRLEIASKESKNEDVRELSNKLVEILGAPGKGCLCNKALRFDIYTDKEKITYTLFNNKLRTIYFKRNDIPIELTDNSSYEKKEIFVGSNIKLNKENNEWKLTIDGETQKTYNDVNKIYKISNGEKKEIKEISQLYPGQEFELVFDDESRIRIINIDDELKIIKGKKYILEESSPPLGYKLKKDQDMNVFTNVPSYKKDEGTVTSNDLVIRPGLKNIVNIQIVDGSLLIKVIDDYNYNKKPIVGATYTILSESEKKIDESKYEWVKPENSEIYELKYKNGDYLKTDDEGKIQVDGLGFGEYALQEKKEGDFYHKTWPKIKFELGESQPEERMDINTHKKGRIALLNVSDSGELIEDSEFSIKSEKTSELNIKDLTDNQFLDKKNPLELKTNNYGLIEIDGLDKDKYQIKQVSVPQEYILDELPLEIELSDQKTSHASLFINRKPELPVTGGPGLTRRLVIASLLIIGGISFLLIYNNKKIRDEKGEVEMK